VKQNVPFLVSFVLLLAVVLGCRQMTTKPGRKDEPDFQISVLELAQDFKKDEAATNAKYQGATLAVTGRVEYRRDFGGSAMTIVFDIPRELGVSVQCFFTEADRESFRQIETKKEYTLLGLYAGRSGRLSISQCKLFER
jgi:hypothetical protein